MAFNTNITEKKYKKLVLQVSLNGFCFAVVDTLHQAVLLFKEVEFKDFGHSAKVEDQYWKAFLDHQELTRLYDEVVVLHDSNLSSFVPAALFDEQFLGSYLQYNTKVFESDFFTFDAMPNQEMNNVYVPYANINNYLLDQFESFDYRHVSSILVGKLLEKSKNIDEKQVFVHFGKERFEIVVVQNQKLILFNSFEFSTEADFIYYLLFTAEQLNLNPEHFKLQLLGAVSEDSAVFKMAYKYVRHVALLDVEDLQRSNSFSTADNLKHFILFQS